MSDGTHIEWTDATWNPLRASYDRTVMVGESPNASPMPATFHGWHCERVSPGCEHCYAETLNEKRFGTGLPYNRKSRERVETYLDEKVLTQPLRWKKPRRIFVCSMTDLFGEWVPEEAISWIFAVMAKTPWHSYQVLTKRPERMRAYLRAHHEVPLWNVWLGVSAEDQQRANERIPVLLDTPAVTRFVSAEPLLGPIDLGLVIVAGQKLTVLQAAHLRAELEGQYRGIAKDVIELSVASSVLDWVIVGGESGPGARPCAVDWIRSLVYQCAGAGVACFVKQLGARPTEPKRVATHSVYPSGRAAAVYGSIPEPLRLRNRKGGDPSEWPPGLIVREIPRVPGR